MELLAGPFWYEWIEYFICLVMNWTISNSKNNIFSVERWLCDFSCWSLFIICPDFSWRSQWRRRAMWRCGWWTWWTWPRGLCTASSVLPPWPFRTPTSTCWSSWKPSLPRYPLPPSSAPPLDCPLGYLMPLSQTSAEARSSTESLGDSSQWDNKTELFCLKEIFHLYHMGGTSQASAWFQDSGILQKALKMGLRCILGVISHFSGFQFVPGPTHDTSSHVYVGSLDDSPCALWKSRKLSFTAYKKVTSGLWIRKCTKNGEQGETLIRKRAYCR